MKFLERIEGAAESVDKAKIKKNKGTLAFAISLIPIPGIQQAGAIATRVIDNAALDQRLSEIETKVRAVSDAAETAQNTAEEAVQIAEILKTNSQLASEFSALAKEIENYLREQEPDFVMETTNYSYQELIASSIEADFAAFISENNSENSVRNSQIRSPKTHLRATDGSINRIHNTEFTGAKGSVSMVGTAQTGDVSVSESSITFGPGSSLILESQVCKKCATCGGDIWFQPSTLKRAKHLKCPHCGQLHEIAHR